MGEFWEKLPHESRKAYAAFCVYRDMGLERSIRKALEEGAKQGLIGTRSLSVLTNWSRKFNWVSRADAYDQHLETVTRRKREQDIKEMRERHARLARAAQAKAVERLNSLKAIELTPKDMLVFIVEAAKLERLSMGEPETHVRQDVQGQVKHQLDLSRLTDEELDDLEQLLGKAAVEGGDPERESTPPS